MTGLDVQEGKQVSIPVSGKVGNVELPQGTALVGRFNRVNEGSGVLVFDTLIANGKMYKINAASAPVPGKLRQDVYDVQNRRDGRDYAKTGIKERREAQQGRATREYGNAAGNIVSNFSPLAGSLIGGAGAIAGTSKETEAVETSTAKQEAVIDRDIPSVLVAEISPMQNLPVQFNEAVDLNTPVASLPQSAQPQPQSQQSGPATSPPVAPAPGTTAPAAPVYPYPYGYPGGSLP